MAFVEITRTAATAENKKWLRIRVRLFTNFRLRIQVRKKRKFKPESTPATPDPWPPMTGTKFKSLIKFIRFLVT